MNSALRSGRPAPVLRLLALCVAATLGRVTGKIAESACGRSWQHRHTEDRIISTHTGREEDGDRTWE